MMNVQANKTSICNIVALDIIDYAKKTSAEKLASRRLFNDFVAQSVMDIPLSDRAILDTAQGAVITFNGALEDALEDALFISITIRDEVLKHNQQNTTPIYLQIGVHLGAARMVNTHISGEGIDEALRIMGFAGPNQILASSVYYEMASKLTQEIAQMFEKYEMHAHDHDIYAVRMLKETAANPAATVEELSDVAPTKSPSFNWNYAGLGLLTVGALFVLATLIIKPVEPTITILQPAPNLPTPAPAVAKAEAPVEPVAEPKVETTTIVEQTPKVEVVVTEEVIKDDKLIDLAANKKAEKLPVKKANTVQKPVKPAAESADEPKKVAVQSSKAKPEKAKPVSTNEEKTTASKPAEASNEKTVHASNKPTEKSGWQTFKDSVTTGTDRHCTQAEIALNQCAR